MMWPVPHRKYHRSQVGQDWPLGKLPLPPPCVDLAYHLSTKRKRRTLTEAPHWVWWDMEEWELCFICCPLPCRSVGPCTTLEGTCPCAWTRSTWSTYQEDPWHTATGWRKYGYTLGVRTAKGQSTSSMDRPSLGRYVGLSKGKTNCQLMRFVAYLYTTWWDNRSKGFSWICEMRRSLLPFSICLLQVDLEVSEKLPLFSREGCRETGYFLLRHWCPSLVTHALKYLWSIISTPNPYLSYASLLTPTWAVSLPYVIDDSIDSIMLPSGTMSLICTKL